MQISEDIIKQDPLANAVKTLVDVMSSDFGERFKQTFTDAEQLRQLKRRLYSKLKGIEVCDIYDGYERLVELKPSFVPTVPEITESILHSQKTRLKHEQNQKEAERLSALPTSKEISDSIAHENLKRIKALLADVGEKMEKKETEAQRKERMVRLEQKRLAHEELLKQDFPLHGKELISITHKCSVGWCDKPGTLSNAISGNGNYFCREHWRKD